MKRIAFGSLLGLLAFAPPPAEAQFFLRPVTNPLQPPFLNPYNPYLYYGNPAALGPYGAYGAAPGGLPPGLTAPGIVGVPTVGAAPTTVQSPDLNDPMITGHPTRFFSYGRYFFNQGGGVVASAETAPGTPGILGGVPAPVTPLVGSPPPRGRSTTGTGTTGR
jgi:hypothetical protein